MSHDQAPWNRRYRTVGAHGIDGGRWPGIDGPSERQAASDGLRSIRGLIVPGRGTVCGVLQDLVDQFHESLLSGADSSRVFGVLDAIRDAARPGDAAILVSALARSDANFFSREMIGEILCRFDQPDLLEPLLVAFGANLADGHDNDGFAVALCGLVGANQRASAETLHGLQANRPEAISADTLEWLLGWCGDDTSSSQ